MTNTNVHQPTDPRLSEYIGTINTMVRNCRRLDVALEQALREALYVPGFDHAIHKLRHELAMQVAEYQDQIEKALP